MSASGWHRVFSSRGSSLSNLTRAAFSSAYWTLDQYNWSFLWALKDRFVLIFALIQALVKLKVLLVNMSFFVSEELYHLVDCRNEHVRHERVCRSSEYLLHLTNLEPLCSRFLLGRIPCCSGGVCTNIWSKIEWSKPGAESGGTEWVIPGGAPARLRQHCSLRNTEHTYSTCTSDRPWMSRYRIRTLTAPLVRLKGLLPHARFKAMAAVVFKSLNYTGSS